MTSLVATRRALPALARTQAGYFTTQQALAISYTYPEQHCHVTRGNWERIAQGIFRLRGYPLTGRADLIVLLLVSHDHSSHETTLALHDLSAVNPARIHLAVPAEFRWQLPPEVALYRRPLQPSEWEERGRLPPEVAAAHPARHRREPHELALS